MMRLCFGTFARVLRVCRRAGVSDCQLVGTMTRIIDPDCGYINPYNAQPVSRLLSCTQNFPTNERQPGSHAKKSGDTISKVAILAIDYEIDNLETYFAERVVNLIDEDKKELVVLALLSIIKSDDTIDINNAKKFKKYIGTTKNALLEQGEYILSKLLAGLFLYCLLCVSNTVGKNYINLIDEEVKPRKTPRKYVFRDKFSTLFLDASLCLKVYDCSDDILECSRQNSKSSMISDTREAEKTEQVSVSQFTESELIVERIKNIDNMVTLREILFHHSSEYASEICDIGLNRLSQRNNVELRKLCQQLIDASRTDELLFDMAIKKLAVGNQQELYKAMGKLVTTDEYCFRLYFYRENLLHNRPLKSKFESEYTLYLNNRISYEPPRELRTSSLFDLSFLSEAIEFSGRKAEIEKLLQFCNETKPFLWSYISGPAGSGKSRLALEFTKYLDANWKSSFLELTNDLKLDKIGIWTNTLIIIDYIVGREMSVAHAMDNLSHIAEVQPIKLRILLIERNNSMQFGGWYNFLKYALETYHWNTLFLNQYPSPTSKALIELRDMDNSMAQDIAQKVYTNCGFVYTTNELHDSLAIFNDIFKIRFRRPLFLQIFCLGWVENHKKWYNTLNKSEIFDWLIGREERRWKQILNRYIISPNDVENSFWKWKTLICYAALLGSIPLFDKSSIISPFSELVDDIVFGVTQGHADFDSKRKIQRFFAEMFGSDNDEINQIEIVWPDIIIEHMFYKYFDRSEENVKTFQRVAEGEYFTNRIISFLYRLRDDIGFDSQIEKIILGITNVSMSDALSKSLSFANNEISQENNVTIDNKTLHDKMQQVTPPPFNSIEESSFFEKIKNNDKEARTILIEQNLRLVDHIVRIFMTESIDYEELLSVGVVGLIKAVNSYTPNRETKFATYAAQCIIIQIRMYLRSFSGSCLIDYSESILDTAEFIDLNNLEGNSVSFIDSIKSPEEITTDLVKHDFATQLKIALMKMPERERSIISLRFGLNREPSLTQREVAARLGISRSYVSRTEKHALQRLRRIFDEIYSL